MVQEVVTYKVAYPPLMSLTEAVTVPREFVSVRVIRLTEPFVTYSLW